MPLKKEEVCGKPNQYNLKTLQYDWKELPDTHIQLPPQKLRVRDYSALAGYGTAENRINPITHQPLPSPGAGLGRAGAVSATPLPSPSRPVQEAMQHVLSPQAHHGNRDHVAELLGGGDGGAGRLPAREGQRRVLPPPLVLEKSPQALANLSSDVSSRDRELRRAAAALPSVPHSVDVVNVVWSHEDIKRVVHTNNLEAQRSYLR